MRKCFESHNRTNSGARLRGFLWAMLWVFGVSFSLGSNAGTVAGPKLELPIKEINLPAQPYDKPLEGAFVLKNAGDQPLKVSLIKKSCGCTALTVTGDEIAAGASVEVKVGYTPGEVDKKTGRQSFTAEFSTNDPEMRVFVLAVHSELLLPVDAAPGKLDFGEIVPGSLLEKELIIRCTDDHRPPQIVSTSVSGLPLVLKPAGEEMEKTTCKRKFKVSLDASQPISSANGSIIIQTDNDVVPVLEVPVSGSVAYPFNAEPRSILFGLVAASERVEKKVLLLARDGAAKAQFPARGASTDARLNCEVVRSSAGSELVVRLAAAEPLGKLETDVSLLDDKGVQVGVVAVHAQITAARIGSRKAAFPAWAWCAVLLVPGAGAACLGLFWFRKKT